MKRHYNKSIETIIEKNTPLQKLIERLHNLSREARHKGFKNLTIKSTIVVYGDILETDEEYKNRIEVREKMKMLSTYDLLMDLAGLRHGYCSDRGVKSPCISDVAYEDTLKEVLATREHVPSKKEAKILRRLMSRTGISNLDELYEKHGKEIAESLGKA